jgi:hypothetical protein
MPDRLTSSIGGGASAADRARDASWIGGRTGGGFGRDASWIGGRTGAGFGRDAIWFGGSARATGPEDLESGLLLASGRETTLGAGFKRVFGLDEPSSRGTGAAARAVTGGRRGDSGAADAGGGVGFAMRPEGIGTTGE